MDRYHRNPRIAHHSVKYTILLALLPLVVWFSIPSRDVKTEPIAEVRVKTETIRKIDMRFEDRWFPLYDPPRVRVRTIPVNVLTEEPKIDDQSARPLVAPNDRKTSSNRPSAKSTRSVRYAYRDICTRHKMRKVYSNNGRSWNCRRV